MIDPLMKKNPIPILVLVLKNGRTIYSYSILEAMVNVGVFMLKNQLNYYFRLKKLNNNF